ncbi:MAG: helix-turn-helix transcriptional regulator [Gammaproteobacteria bacterium]|jgi:DNA-binding CsgD family transcriptional regulator|nr:helix-turn-helix transcriptional regulator [Gammaproteobacteria bacterium]MBT4811672.1 helix-turn-helix transcriptional regulator [Thiotrichales bacterium]MBT3968537.1 helix-turn-helix transcriptional regulator [Gammaproteobacteria bacterium]MBT4079304.1 helix-turn-helix transcriptional regulator [Gammaproteobacteria bacterium]MBT4329072.1 helix-turn-helix transcriptional regulator [Gammaproteobacteria bacterium]
MPDTNVPDALGRLTPRERQILKLLAEGHRNSEVAELLFLSVRSIEKYRSGLNDKRASAGFEDFVGFARQQRLID